MKLSLSLRGWRRIALPGGLELAALAPLPTNGPLIARYWNLDLEASGIESCMARNSVLMRK